MRRPGGIGEIDRDRGPQRRAGGVALKDIAGVVGPGDGIGGIGKLPEPGRPGRVAAVKSGLRCRSDAGTHGFRQVDRGFARSRLGQFHHRLSGADDLPRFRQSFDDGSIGIGEQRRIVALVLCDLELCLGG